MSSGTSYTRVAVVQLAYHPAIVMERRSPLEDPLGDARGHSLLPSSGDAPDAYQEKLSTLQRRIRETYNAQLLARVRAILDTCRRWKVRLVVFPEYSLSWELLERVAQAAGDMVVVAGSHTVDRAARKSGLYTRLGAPTLPSSAQSVCPVLYQGRLLTLQSKLNPAVPEQGSMQPGEVWAPVALPAESGLPGPMGVLICLDFLFRESERSRHLVAPQLGQCRFLAVPSLTPHYTQPEFSGKAWEEARRYARPVLYCDGAEGGGTAIYVDEGAPSDLRQFPTRSGYLEPGDEGVIVADVNLGYERVGPSTRYDAPRPVVPVAEATLVYPLHGAGQAYARWLEEMGPLLERDDDEALDSLVEEIGKARSLLLNAGALPGASARSRRLRKLLASLDKVTRVEEVRSFLREVVLPSQVLPLDAVRGALARGAANAVFAWLGDRQARAAGWTDVEVRLRKAAEAVTHERTWTDEARREFDRLVREVDGTPEPQTLPREAPRTVKVVLPAGVELTTLGDQAHGGWKLSFKEKPGDLRADRAVAPEGSPKEARHPESTLHGKEREAGFRFTEAQVEDAEELLFLAQAGGAERVATLGVLRDGAAHLSTLLIVWEASGGWTVWAGDLTGWQEADRQGLLEALRAVGLEGAALVAVPPEARSERIQSLVPLFQKAHEGLVAFHAQRLREVEQQFVPPEVQVDEKNEPVSALKALDAWLDSEVQTALVLGEFGSGKSTLLAEWALVRWGQAEGPRVLLVDLAQELLQRDAEDMLLGAAKLAETKRHRAALRLLVRRRLLIPCFDGFDELATRLEAAVLPGQLAQLLAVAQGGGKVVISSRSHYFATSEELRDTVSKALTRALGPASSQRRLVLQPFGDEQVADLVRKVLKDSVQAEQALERISKVYDLRELVHRPLLLGMVLTTLEQLKALDPSEPDARITRATLYEAYLERWLDQTRSADPSCLSDDQKRSFAEALAEKLWRSGSPTCSWRELQETVKARLAQHLPENIPSGAAILEIQGGAFFVHEGADHYRFAHKSFLEYFLARALVHTLPERPLASLETHPLTKEVSEFVGEILRLQEADLRKTRTVRAVQDFLTETRPLTTGHAKAAANAVRLLLGLSRWTQTSLGWIPDKADLRGVVLAREDLRGVWLREARLEQANLAAADLSGADLSGAVLDRACLAGARLDKTVLRRVSARGTDFTQAEAEQAVLEEADLREARLRHSLWLNCQWTEARLDGAKATAWAAPGARPVQNEALSVSRNALDVLLTTGHRGQVRAVAWSPQGERLASAGADGTVRLWEAASGRELSRLEGHGDLVLAVAWSPEGERLASAGDDGTVRLWEAASGRELSRLEGHGGWVRAVAWSPEGERLASAGADGTVRLWEANRRALLGRFSSVEDESLACSPGGFYVLTTRKRNARPERVRLALRRRDGATCLYLPLGGLHATLHRPERVAAALSGDLGGDDAWAELERQGLGEGSPWDGTAVVLSSPPSSRGAQDSRPALRKTGPSAFLKRVKLRNYRSIAACDVRLGALTFLVGPNGAGKSNFLDALRLLTEALQGSLDKALLERGGFHEVRRRASNPSDHFDIHIEFGLPDGKEGHFALQVAKRGGGWFIRSEECRNGAAFYRVREGKVESTVESVLPPAQEDRVYLGVAAGLQEFRPIFEALSHMGFYSLQPDRMRQPHPPASGALLQRDGFNLSSVLDLLERVSPTTKERIEEYLRHIVPGVERVETRRDGNLESLEFSQGAAGASQSVSFPATSMSDGTLRALGILVALFQADVNERIQVIGIEEPEVALHPAAAGILRDALREGARHAQVIVTSHSPELLDDPDVRDEELVSVVAEQGVTRISRLDEAARSALHDRLYTAGELMKAGQLTPETRAPSMEGEEG